MWRTTDLMTLAVIKRNIEKGFYAEDQIEWLIKQVEYLEDNLRRQRKHEDFLLGELKKLGWFENGRF